MFKLFLFIGLFSTISCESLDLNEIKPEFTLKKKTFNEDLSSLNELLPITSTEKCKNSPIIIRTLELIMSIMNQNMQRQAHTTYILNLLIKIIEKNTEGFSIKEQEVMTKVLEALENYQGPTLQAHSALRSQSKPASKGLTRTQKSYCADALLKISQIATDAYNKLTNDPLDDEDSNTLSNIFQNFALPGETNDKIHLAIKGIPYSVKNNEQPSKDVLNNIIGQIAEKNRHSNRLKHSPTEIHGMRTTTKQNISPDKENIHSMHVQSSPPRMEYRDITTEKMSSVNEILIQNYPWYKRHDHFGKQFEINDIEPTTRRLIIMKEIFDIHNQTPKPIKEIKISQYRYPSSNNSLQIEIVTGSDLDQTTESSLPSFVPYGNKKIDIEEQLEVTTRFTLTLKDSTESPHIAYDNPSYGSHLHNEVITHKKYYPHDNFENIENWPPEEYLVPINGHYYAWKLESSTIAPSDFYHENYDYNPQNQNNYDSINNIPEFLHSYDEMNQAKPDFEYSWNIEQPLNQNSKQNPWSHELQFIVNGEVDSSQNYNQPTDYEKSPWALEIEVSTATPLHDNRILWNTDKSKLGHEKNLNLVENSPYAVSNAKHAFGYNPNVQPFSKPQEEYISIEDLTGPDNDKFWAYDTYLWHMGIELPEIKMPMSQVVDSNGVPISPSDQLSYYPKSGPLQDVEFINSIPENLVIEDTNLFYKNKPGVNNLEYWSYNEPMVENGILLNTEISVPIEEVTTRTTIYEDVRTTLITTAIPHIIDEFLDQDSGYFWPYQNPSKYEIEVTTRRTVLGEHEIEPVYGPNWLPTIRPDITNNYVNHNSGQYWPSNQNPSHNWQYHQTPSDILIDLTTKTNITIRPFVVNEYVNQSPDYYWHYHKNSPELEIEVTTKRYISIDHIIDTNPDDYLHYNLNPGQHWFNDQNPDHYWPYNYQNPSEVEVTTKILTSANQEMYTSPDYFRPYYQNPDYYWPYPSDIEIEQTTKISVLVENEIEPIPAYNVFPLPTKRPHVINNYDWSYDQNPSFNGPYEQTPQNYWHYDQNPLELEIELTTNPYFPINYDIHSNADDNFLPLPTIRPIFIDQNYGHYWPQNQNPINYWPYYQKPSEFEIDITTKRYISVDQEVYINPDLYWPYDQNPSNLETEINTINMNSNPAYNVLPTVRPIVLDQNLGHHWPYNQNPDYYWSHDQNPSEVEIEVTTRRYISVDHNIYSNPVYNVFPFPTSRPFAINEHVDQNPNYYQPYNQNPSDIEITTKTTVLVEHKIEPIPAYNVLPLPTVRPIFSKQYPGHHWSLTQNPAYYGLYNQQLSELEIEVTTNQYISVDQEMFTNPDYFRPYDQNSDNHGPSYDKNPSDIEIEITKKKYIAVDYNKDSNSVHNWLPVSTLRPVLFDLNPGHHWPDNQNPDHYWPYDQNPSDSEIEVTTQITVLFEHEIEPIPAYNLLPLPSKIPFAINKFDWSYDQNPSKLEVDVTTNQYIPDNYYINSSPHYNVLPLQVIPIFIDQNPDHYWHYNQNPDYYWPKDQKTPELINDETEVTTEKYISVDEDIYSNLPHYRPFDQNPDYYWSYNQNPTELEIDVTTKRYISIDQVFDQNPDYDQLFDQNPAQYWPYYENPGHYRPYNQNPSVIEIEVTTKKHISVNFDLNSYDTSYFTDRPFAINNNVDQNLDYFWPHNQNPSNFEIEVTTKRYITVDDNINSYPAYNWLPVNTVRPLVINKHFDQNPDYLSHDQNPSELEIEVTTKRYISVDEDIYSNLPQYLPFDQNQNYYWSYNQNPKELEIDVTTKRYISIDQVLDKNPDYDQLFDQNPAQYWPYYENPGHYRPYNQNPSVIEIEVTTKKHISVNFGQNFKQWDLEIKVPSVRPTLHGHLINENPLYISKINQYWNQYPETINNRYIVTNDNGNVSPTYHENAYNYYWNQPHEISTQGYIAIDDIAEPHPNQHLTSENLWEPNYLTIADYMVSTNPGIYMTTERSMIQNNPKYATIQGENYFPYDFLGTTLGQPFSANPVLTDSNYYPWGHNVQITTSRSIVENKISKYENSYPVDFNGQLELQHNKWMGNLPNKGSITIINQGPDINIVHKPHIIENINGEDETSHENVFANNENYALDITKQTIKVTEATTQTSTAGLNSLESIDSIFPNSDEETEKSVEQTSSNMMPVSEKLVISQNNESTDPDSSTEFIDRPPWNYADNGALIFTDPIEMPSNDEAVSSEVINTELTDLDISDNVETETQIIHLIKEKLYEIEKKANSENELKILNIINKIRLIISGYVTKDKYLDILTYYDKLSNYLKPNSKSKMSFIINRLYNLPVQNNLELNSEDNVVELTYLVRRPKPIVIYPYYYIKYKIPFHKIDKLVKENPDLIVDDDNLHAELLKTSEIAEKSPALKNVTEHDLLALTVDHGDVINTKLVSTSSDKETYLLEDFEDENTVYTRQNINNNPRNSENQPSNFNSLSGDTIHLTIKQNDKAFDTISIENRHFPIEEKNGDQLNDLNNPFRELFPLYKLKQATDEASAASRQGYNPNASKLLQDYYKNHTVKPLLTLS